jgi:hypothetical protein
MPVVVVHYRKVTSERAYNTQALPYIPGLLLRARACVYVSRLYVHTRFRYSGASPHQKSNDCIYGALPGSLAGDHLIDDHAQAVHVCTVRDLHVRGSRTW